MKDIQNTTQPIAAEMKDIQNTEEDIDDDDDDEIQLQHESFWSIHQN